jgi:hypothetical protein
MTLKKSQEFGIGSGRPEMPGDTLVFQNALKQRRIDMDFPANRESGQAGVFTACFMPGVYPSDAGH